MIRNLRRKIILFLILWLSYLLQTTVFSSASLFSVRPNLLLIATVSFAFMQGEDEGIYLGFLSGLLVDLFSGGILGYYALLYLCCGYFAGKLQHVFFTGDLRLPVLLTAAFDLVLNIVIYITQFLFRDRIHFAVYFRDIIIPEMVFTAILSFVLYRLYHRINQRLLAREREEAHSVWIRD